MNCFVDYKISTEEKYILEKLGFTVIKVPRCSDVYRAIDGHPDIQICILDKPRKKIIINRNLPKYFKDTLLKNNIDFIESSNKIKSPYPNNIGLNALLTNDFLIHKIDSTDINLLESLKDMKKFINVNQGYTKCSCLQVSDNAIITNDKGLYKALTAINFDVLLLPYGDIELEDFEYGFIGGVGGMISDKELAFFGSLEHYKYGSEVKSFLKKYSVTPIYLKNSRLVDKGSLFTL